MAGVVKNIENQKPLGAAQTPRPVLHGDDVIVMSLNRSRLWSLTINSIKFGNNPTSIMAENANGVQKSTIFSQNQ